jgi:hypothetical protein
MLPCIEHKNGPRLADWDYSDEEANSTVQQINRQKSARHLEIVQFDSSEPRAFFYDHKRKRVNTATLATCDCSDFTRQKNVKPCMHIYRVAIEVGLIDPKYFGGAAQFVIAAKLSREETERLRSIAVDSSQWGGWASQIHESGIQRNRQYRAYFIDEHDIVLETSVHMRACGWEIHGYSVSLDSCDCIDFAKRKLPCKHIYSAALASRISLPFTKADFESARKQGLELVFQFEC